MKPAVTDTKNIRGIKLVLRSLRNRNYRLFFMGQGTSLVGTWMQQTAMSWLVYRLTNSAFFLGVVGFTSQLPTFLIAPFAGVIADKWSRHKMLLATQSLLMIQALILAILVMTGHIAVWHIIVLSIFLGAVNAFDMPTRQAFVYELVDKEEDLPNAITLNSMNFNAARLAGPFAAGILIDAVGEGSCFLINAVSFVAVLMALMAIKIAPQKIASKHNGAVLSGLKDGVTYAFGFAPIRIILTLLAFISLVGAPYAVLAPVFARDVLHGGPKTLGFLMGAVAVGAMVGAIFLALQKTARGLGEIIVMAISVLGVSVIVFSFSETMWFSMLMISLAGFGMIVQMASINTILQTIVDNDKRGRIMSLYVMAFIGVTSLGCLLAGIVAAKLGAPRALQISGLLCLLAAAVFYRKLPMLKEMIRPIYVKKGIIPQVAAGIDVVTQLTMPTKE